ncbi:hypothetical protein niasHT_013548 [Heterodera trifolii]|uniref:Uncharacterized protein n=1 Tax=Heterodera trifolii TaxID=157864 RepID=A0ABD2LDZ1_9BILA
MEDGLIEAQNEQIQVGGPPALCARRAHNAQIGSTRKYQRKTSFDHPPLTMGGGGEEGLSAVSPKLLGTQSHLGIVEQKHRLNIKQMNDTNGRKMPRWL